MNHHGIPPELRDYLYCVDRGLLSNDRRGRAVDRAYRLGIRDDLVIGEIQRRVKRDVVNSAFRGPFRNAPRQSGDFLQGADAGGSDIWYPGQYRNEPSLCVASTGSGKTNLSRFEILMMVLLVTGMWLFDLRKNEYAVLRPMLRRLQIDLQVVRAKDCRINPLQVPEGVSPSGYASVLADALVGVLDLPPVSHRTIFQVILVLYRQHGVLDGGRSYPTLHDLYEAVATNRAIHASVREAILTRLGAVLMSLGPALAYRQGWSSSDLAGLRIAWAFWDISEVDQNLLLNMLLISEFMSRLARGISNQRMNLWIVCDEAGRVIRGAESSISQWIGQIRGLGIGLSLSNQTADISRAVLANTPTKQIGRVASYSDLEQLGSSIGLTREQKQYLLHNLKPGTFAMQLSQGEGGRHPFLFSVPLVRVPQDFQVTDEMSAGLRALPVIPAEEYEDWQPEWARSPVTTPGKSSTFPASTEPAQANKANDINLPESHRRVLVAIVESDCLAASEIPGAARISKNRATEIRESLRQGGFVTVERIQRSGRGRPALMVFPTEKGKAFVSLGGAL